MFGLPANDPNIILNGPDPGINGEEVEADLDVQWSGAVAKGATIDFVVSQSTETTPGIDLSAFYIIDNDLAPVMSESYGPCEASLGAGGNTFHSTLWEQAAAQGITVLISAGDSGSATCDYALSPAGVALSGLSVNGLASTPFDVAVGGTDFNDPNDLQTYWNVTNSSPSQSSAKSYIPESTWNDSCAASGSLTGCANASSSQNFKYGFDLVAGGGGPSNCTNPGGAYPNFTCPGGGYPKPSWQTGSGVPNDGARDVPDVSLFSGNGLNFSIYVICQMDANASNGGSSTSCDLNSPFMDFQAVGGTSASVQAFAGIMALVNQAHGRQGNANFVLYPLAAQGGASCASTATMAADANNSSCIFYDVIAGNNSVACASGSPDCSNTSIASGQLGILVSGGLPSAAWTTTAGYDLATGLGSVNAANLVNKWTSNFTPSTTTLELSTSPATNPITQVHGQPINFKISVPSGQGTPAGDVSLIAQTGSSSSNVTGIGPFTLSGGTVSGSTIMLPGGTYNVTAHYAGNGTFAASDSYPGIPVTVGRESSLTKISLVVFGYDHISATTVNYGSPYFLRMDVTNVGGQLCAPTPPGLISYSCPTGNLTVSPVPSDENPPPGTIAGSYTLNSQGYAEDQPIQLSPGLYNFVASYGGDNSYQPSNSPTLPITIAEALTNTGISGLPGSAVAGTQISILVTLQTTSNGLAPTGTIQLMNIGAPLGSSVPVTGSGYSVTSPAYAIGRAVLTISLPGGNLGISAQYSGDANYGASTSPVTPLTVSDFSLSANPSPVTISAPGQTGNSIISVTPQNGFVDIVRLTVASGCPAGATCTFSSPFVYMTSASGMSDTLTISTTASTDAPPTRQPRVPPIFRSPAGYLWLWAGSLALVMLLSSSAIRRRPAPLLLATTLFMVALWAACGGGGGGGGGSTPALTPTPAGTYPIVVNAVSGPDTHSITVDVTVQ